MSVIQVRSDDGQHVVDVLVDEEAHASASCQRCPWATEPGRADYLADVIADAQIHVDGLDR